MLCIKDKRLCAAGNIIRSCAKNCRAIKPSWDGSMHQRLPLPVKWTFFTAFHCVFRIRTVSSSLRWMKIVGVGFNCNGSSNSNCISSCIIHRSYLWETELMRDVAASLWFNFSFSGKKFFFFKLYCSLCSMHAQYTFFFVTWVKEKHAFTIDAR